MQSFLRTTFSGTLRTTCQPFPRLMVPTSPVAARCLTTTGPSQALRSFGLTGAKRYSRFPSEKSRFGAWVGAGTVAAVGLHMSLSPFVAFERAFSETLNSTIHLTHTPASPPAAPSPARVTPSSAAQVPPEPTSSEPVPPPLPPKSSINLYELSFGTVCGICAGVFVKKGAKAVAFFLGGVFVMLQVRLDDNDVITVYD